MGHAPTEQAPSGYEPPKVVDLGHMRDLTLRTKLTGKGDGGTGVNKNS